MLKILCLGAGAVGGYFCGRLAEAGSADVTFLVRDKRKQQLDTNGLVIDSPLGAAKLPVRAVTRAEDAPPPDIVVVTAKAYDLDSAIEAIRPAVGPGTSVLPLLNGLAHMAKLDAAFGPQNVLGGLASIHVTMLPDGTIKHSGNWRFVTFGERDGTMRDRVAALKTAFDAAKGVTATAVPDVQQKMWEKLVMLGTLAGMTTLMRTSVGNIAKAGGARLSHAMLEGNNAIAAANGHPMPAELLAGYRKFFADETSPMTASMLRDMERGGPVEADHIVGHLLGEARRLGHDTRLLEASYVNLKAYELSRAS